MGGAAGSQGESGRSVGVMVDNAVDRWGWGGGRGRADLPVRWRARNVRCAVGGAALTSGSSSCNPDVFSARKECCMLRGLAVVVVLGAVCVVRALADVKEDVGNGAKAWAVAMMAGDAEGVKAHAVGTEEEVAR